jgi:hypothetical protein
MLVGTCKGSVLQDAAHYSNVFQGVCSSALRQRQKHLRGHVDVMCELRMVGDGQMGGPVVRVKVMCGCDN